MKQTMKITPLLLLLALLLLGTVSCRSGAEEAELWASAVHQADATLGEGANTVAVEIVAGECSVTLTLKTDKVTLGEALYEQGLLNDPVFFDTCNGIVADWEKDQAYWSFYVDGELASFGVGDEKAATNGDASYRIVYSK